MTRVTVTVLIASAVLGAAAVSAAPDEPRVPVLKKVVDCRAITDDRARLACYDASVAELDQASVRGDIAIVDKEEVKRTRRALFGFSLPDVGALFGGGRGDKNTPAREAAQEVVKEITAKVRAVGRNADGGVVVTLEDGARWEQTDSVILGRYPKPGSVATIKRAALGSFKMSFDGGQSMRARRTG